ncbi:sporulation protein [Caldibacillus debilis]|uniref:sporulation protein n=1 Tax=Caldibacillus debilis TaxID=301148 RepID=UPI000369192F|nr:sporulation protein [Caldibacillus debilis]MBO2482197.1 sporulation protein SpoOM [Bacillaceae bacterium]MBY6272501.1 sporulation protein SpoOM [Bacillaceae bacterium]REJ31196.1 MAG: sporulation protein SpoOM [Caldibacillus debilis]
MSFVNKLLASVGIGSATVDTKIFRSELVPGEKVEGIVQIRGGNVEQQIDSIYLSLYTTYELKKDDRRVREQIQIGRYRLTQSLVIRPNEGKEIPFSFELPLDTPLTIGKTKVWVRTGLDIKNAVDPADRDYISIVPTPLTGAIFHSLSQLGFRLRNADCEQAKGIFRNRLPFIQEFEFVPVRGPFRGKLDELEVVFFPKRQGVEVLMEVDRKARGFASLLAEALEMDESLVRFTVSEQDIPNLTEIIGSVISRYS